MEHHKWNVGELLGVSGSYWKACTLHAGVRLEVFTLIGDGAAGADEIRRTFRDRIDLEDDLHWVDYLVKLAAEVLPLYASTALDYDLLEAEVSREQRQLADLEERAEVCLQHPRFK